MFLRDPRGGAEDAGVLAADERDVPVEPDVAEPAHEFDAVHAGHLQVAEDQPNTIVHAFQQAQDLVTARTLEHGRIPGGAQVDGLELARQKFSRQRVVVEYQDVHGRVRSIGDRC